MIRFFVYLLVVFALGLGFAWLADRPGNLVVTLDGYQYRFSLMAAATLLVAIVATVMIAWWLVKAVWNSPYTIARYFRVRRRDRGYQALSTGMIAAGAGDGALARKMNREAAKLIRSETEPLVQLLDAQASLLEGDHQAAREKFEAMLEDPEMRLLGLRGLYLEAERLGDQVAARHYARRAAEAAPQLAWAAKATIEEHVAARDWDGALDLLAKQKPVSQKDRDTVKRQRAVILTAKAMALADTDPDAARAAALEANRLQPEFAPAAVAAARALFRQNDIRKGSKILETAWRAEAHPDIGALYVHARPGDAAGDRLARARRLQSLRQNNAESSVLVARTALEAGDIALARSEAEAAARMDPLEGTFLLLADIEEADGADEGRIRQYLARAVRAPRDPAWVADGVVSESWAPASPVTGRIDAFEWRAPVERLGPLIEADDFSSPLLPVIPEREDAPASREAMPSESDAPVVVIDPEPAPPSRNESANGPLDRTEPAPPPPDLPRPPDDPGVDPDEENERRRGFRLF